MRRSLFRLSLIFSLLFFVPSGFLSAQNTMGARVVYSGLPDDESIFTCFLFRGATYVASSPDDDPRTVTLWRLEESVLTPVRDMSIPSRGPYPSPDIGPVHTNPKIQLPFFARTAGWIYFLDATGSSLTQLYRTDGITTQRLTNFTGNPTTIGNRSFFDSVQARHLHNRATGGAANIDATTPEEYGPFFIYEQLDGEPDRLYYLVLSAIESQPGSSTSRDVFRVELYAITDAADTPTRVVENVFRLGFGKESDFALAFYSVQNLGGRKTTRRPRCHRTNFFGGVGPLFGGEWSH